MTRPDGYIRYTDAISKNLNNAVPLQANAEVTKSTGGLVLYYQGNINLLAGKILSIIGTREATESELRRAAMLGRKCAENGITVLSGLARGVDTYALGSAMKHGGKVIGVIGTPLDYCYPPENRDMQNEIAKKHLLISQFPIDGVTVSRSNFVLRNKTMAELSAATMLIATGDGGGSLHQLNFCVKARKTIFLVESSLNNPEHQWPKKYVSRACDNLTEEEKRLLPSNVFVLSDFEKILSFFENPS
jgi:DNA processing protein